jgi:hypothetical protein
MSEPGGDDRKVFDEFTARMLLGGARGVMDPYAQEIFDLWFSGTAPDEVIFDSPKWADYMKADKGLERIIDDVLFRHAKFLRDEALRAGKVLPDGRIDLRFQAYQVQFHGEVGTQTGGYNSGYAVLHGSNRAVGDVQVSGTISIEQASVKAPSLTVKYTNNVLTFNDIVDPNYQYGSDASFDRLARSMTRAMGQRPPKNYTLRIVWREAGPWVYEIPVEPSKTGADWLKPYPRGFR